MLINGVDWKSLLELRLLHAILYPSEDFRCSAKNSHGYRCANRSTENTYLCHVHKDK